MDILLFNNLNNNIEMDPVTSLGLTILFFYCMTQILSFYGVNQSTYGVYVLFYILIALCIVILPRENPSF
jgi:hypothetical protein